MSQGFSGSSGTEIRPLTHFLFTKKTKSPTGNSSNNILSWGCSHKTPVISTKLTPAHCTHSLITLSVEGRGREVGRGRETKSGQLIHCGLNLNDSVDTVFCQRLCCYRQLTREI